MDFMSLWVVHLLDLIFILGQLKMVHGVRILRRIFVQCLVNSILLMTRQPTLPPAQTVYIFILTPIIYKLAVRSTSVEDENVFDGILFFPFEFLGNIPGWMTMMWEFLSLPFVVDATKIFIFLCIGAVVLKLY